MTKELVIASEPEAPSERTYGRVLESFYLSGHSFERALDGLKALLLENRWQELGFSNVNDFIKSIDLSRFQRSVAERKELVELFNAAGVSQRAAAQSLDVDPATVRTDLGVRENPSHSRRKPQEGQDEDDGEMKENPSPDPDDEEEDDEGDEQPEEPPGKDTIATKWTGDPESYTPAKYIVAARQVMGAIDLDPASNDLAQQTVAAKRWFDKEDDGLSHPWKGRVFINPPYSFPTIEHFIAKLCVHCERGEVTQAILLTNNNTDTAWWHMAMKRAAAICFTAGRINFYKADGSITSPTNGQNFFYFGGNPEKFASVFKDFGLIMVKP